MSNTEVKKFYWLKLKKDFFKRHDIQIIESMPNGKDYILFYLKLLCESLDHEGDLRFSEQIPYSEQMLSTITNTNIDIVRSAIKVFTELGMMDIMDDGTLFMSEVHKMIGFETEWAKKKREYRQRQLEDSERTKKDNVRQEKEIEIEIDKEILSNESIKKSASDDADSLPEEQPKKSRFKAPTVDEVKTYANEKGLTKLDANTFFNYYESKGWYVGKSKMKDWKAAARNWNSRQKSYDRDIPRNRSSGFKNYTERENEDLLELERKLLG